MELHLEGSAIRGAAPSSFSQIVYFLSKNFVLEQRVALNMLTKLLRQRKGGLKFLKGLLTRLLIQFI